MTNFKLMTTLATSLATAAALTAMPAFAQDDAPVLDTNPDTTATDFSAADLDQDGSLNADEFVTFAVMRAEDGDETFKDLVMSGEYDDTFAAHDKDASGGIDSEELGHGDAAKSMDDKMHDGMEKMDEMGDPEL